MSMAHDVPTRFFMICAVNTGPAWPTLKNAESMLLTAVEYNAQRSVGSGNGDTGVSDIFLEVSRIWKPTHPVHKSHNWHSGLCGFRSKSPSSSFMCVCVCALSSGEAPPCSGCFQHSDDVMCTVPELLVYRVTCHFWNCEQRPRQQQQFIMCITYCLCPIIVHLKTTNRFKFGCCVRWFKSNWILCN